MRTKHIAAILIVSIAYTIQFGGHWLDILVIVVASLAFLFSLISSKDTAVCYAPQGSDDVIFASTAAQDKEIPKYPHLEGAFEPSTGLLIGNPDQPDEFENDRCKGKYIFLHRPTFDKDLDALGEYPYADHFKKRKRVWENRFQMSFKDAPEGELYFGIELEMYVPMDAATKACMKAVVGRLRPMVGDALYHSVGDDPAKHTDECEKPRFMMPLWAFDQFIETPEGEEPPSLTDPKFAELGWLRTKRVTAFRNQLNDLNIRPGPTYTFAFYGISRLLDVILWQLTGIPLVTPLPFNKLCGCPPVRVTMYTLEPGDEKRHLESRKRVYFNLAFWSSLFRPSADKLHRIVPGAFAEKPKECKDPRHRSSWLMCCVQPRPN